MKCIFATWIFLLSSTISLHAQFTQYFYPNGKVSSEGTMKDGKPDGYWRTYYEDGGLKTEGYRLNFELDSTWKFYRTDSTLERVITYKANLKTGPEQIYDAKGKLLEEFINVNNIKNGEAKYFYESGILKKTIPFSNNKEEGRGFEYAEDGRTITITMYRNGFIYAEEIINRYNAQGNRTGIWKDLYPMGNVREEGNWANGKRNGVFKFFDKNGKLIKMEKYDMGELVVDTDQSAIIDIRKEFYDDGSLKMEGSYSGGKKNGTFREYDVSGNQVSAYIYESDILTGIGMVDSIGRRQGNWKLLFPDGKTRAEGIYVDGKKDGNWTFYFNTGKIEQKGGYKQDLPTGAWKWMYANGSTWREELYRKGKEDGHAVEYDSIGNVICEGDFVDGLKTGPWKCLVNNHTEEGEYLDGELNGEWIWKYANGQKAFQGEFQSGVPVGKHKYWYDNGIPKMKGGYEGGELSGKWEYYREDGTLDLEIEYEAGLAVRINGQKIKLPEPIEE
jgi:antitoxin component YwqK of YwqJK toxin-antitoxin module